MSYNGWAKGRTIELAEPLPFPEGQALRVSVEPVSPTPRRSSPLAILEAMRGSPRLQGGDVDALEAAIQHGKLPMQEGFVLNEGP